MQPILNKYAAVCVRCPDYGTRYGGLLGAPSPVPRATRLFPSSMDPRASALLEAAAIAPWGAVGRADTSSQGCCRPGKRPLRLSLSPRKESWAVPCPLHSHGGGAGTSLGTLMSGNPCGPRGPTDWPFPSLALRPWACHILCVTRDGIRSSQPGTSPFPRKEATTGFCHKVKMPWREKLLAQVSAVPANSHLSPSWERGRPIPSTCYTWR